MSRIARLVHRLAGIGVWAALRLSPASFRERYGRSVIETFDDQVQRAHEDRGLLGVVWVALAETTDAFRRAVQLRFTGDKGPTPDTLRSARGSGLTEWTGSFGQDTRFALRTFRRQPLLALTIVLLLAVSIGANSAIFSVVNAYLLRPLPFPDSDRLVTVGLLPPGSPNADWRALPNAAWGVQWPARDAVIDHLVAWDLDGFTLVGGVEPEAVPGAWVTPGYFGAIGAVAEIGRVFDRSDAQPGAPQVAVISHGLWTRRFAQDPEVVGRAVTAFSGDRPFEGETFTVVGVLPADFWFLNRSTDFLTPLRGGRSPSLVRIREGVSLDRAIDHFTAIVGSEVDGLPPNWRMHAEPAGDRYVASVRPVILVLAGAVGLVLLLACSNVAILLMVRAVSRSRELTVRRAMGANRGRIVRQLLTEGLVLATAAGIIGVGLAWFALDVLGPTIQQQLSTSVPGGVSQLAVDPVVLLVTLGLSLATGLLFALVPALTATGGSLTASLNEGGRGGTDSRRRHAVRNLLIVGEVAVSLALLVGAALMIRTASNLANVDLGFAAENVLTAHVSLRERNYPEAEQQTVFVDRLETEMAAMPGVASATVFAQWPFQGAMTAQIFSEQSGADDTGLEAGRYVVGADYFDVAGIPLVRGRGFEQRDREGADPVAVVGASLARQLWPGADPLGRRLRLGAGPDGEWRTIVGVVGDVREELIGPEVPDVFVPYAQAPRLFLFAMIRVRNPGSDVAGGLRRVVAGIDGTAAVTRVAWLTDIVASQGARPRFLASLLTGFGAFAAGIALFGLYSLISYSVGQRRQEVAVRIALGAHPKNVVAMFVRSGGVVIGAGILAGLAAGLALTQTLESQLFGVAPREWTVFAGTAVSLAVVALGAVWLSARRAAETEPSAALRS